jgi:hypothetical protein
LQGENSTREKLLVVTNSANSSLCADEQVNSNSPNLGFFSQKKTIMLMSDIA